MTTLTMLIGLPASGKSTYAKKHAEYNEAVIVSSDSVRAEKYGSEEIQGNNATLFNDIHNTIIAFLKEGRNVFFDATNINRKFRMELLRRLSPSIYKKAIVFCTPLEICLNWNKIRIRIVPEFVFDRMIKNFNIPTYNEGFDEIELVYPTELDFSKYTIENYLKNADKFEQNNPNHSKTLGEHSRAVEKYCSTLTTDKNVLLAAILHDIGKLSTGSFTDVKGNPTNICHYYNHENVGAYESLFYLKNLNLLDSDILYISMLINFHMRLYQVQSEKAKNKLLQIVGEEMYNDLLILNEADRNSK